MCSWLSLIGRGLNQVGLGKRNKNGWKIYNNVWFWGYMASKEKKRSKREWLSWWSTTLPRSGSRVRVPSRAFFICRKSSFHEDSGFFVILWKVIYQAITVCWFWQRYKINICFLCHNAPYQSKKNYNVINWQALTNWLLFYWSCSMTGKLRTITEIDKKWKG